MKSVIFLSLISFFSFSQYIVKKSVLYLSKSIWKIFDGIYSGSNALLSSPFFSKVTSELFLLYEAVISSSVGGRHLNLCNRPNIAKKAAQHTAAMTPRTAFV